MAKTLGQKLRQYRHLKGFTLREVEKKTKISNAYLNQMENNKVKQPSPIFLSRLVKLYEVPPLPLFALAGYAFLAKEKTKKKRSGLASGLMKDLTPEEEEELLKYLEFIRFKKRSKNRV